MSGRRALLAGIVAAGSIVAVDLPARAQTQTKPYPSRSITLIVPFAAGGFNDVIARIVAEHMARTLGQSIVIENDAGAGGTTATRRAAQAAADGYTIVAGSMGTHGAAPSQYPNLRYDPVDDFTHIGLIAEAPAVIVTRKDFPANDLAEFIAYVKKNQASVNEAHAGAGSQMHTYCSLLHSLLGTRTGRIGYRGGAPAINDLVAGQVDFSCVSVNTVAAQIQGGTVKALAVAGPERVAVIKDVPTTAEAGLPEFQVSGWSAMFAPRNLPPEVLARLSGALGTALDDAATARRLLDIGCSLAAKDDRTPQALRKRVESEVARWSAVLKRQ